MQLNNIIEQQREIIEQQRQAAEAAQAAAEQRVTQAADVSAKRVEETAVVRRTAAITKMFRTRTHADFHGKGTISAYSACIRVQ